MSMRITQNLTRGRASATGAKNRGWFSKIKKYVGQNHLADVWNDPKRN